MSIIIANRLKEIKPSATLEISALAASMKGEGHDIISLSMGEPDFDTPEHIRNAAILAIGQGKTKYTPADGIPELKEAIVRKFSRDNGLDYSIQNISVGSGAKQVLFNAFMATINKGDEVIIPAPYWVSYPQMVELVGGNSVIIDCGEKEDFKLTPDKLKSSITERTKWLLFNSPCNPTGAVYSYEEIKGLTEVLIEFPQVYIMCDDIYEHLNFMSEPFYTMAQVEPRLRDRILIVNGVSKAYAMTGWRIGYAAGPIELINAMRTVQSQTTSNPCSISQYAAVAALSDKPGDYYCKSFKSRRDLIHTRLSSIEGIECKVPMGAFYIFPNCKGLLGKQQDGGEIISSCSDVAKFFLRVANVAVVPGVAFGAPGFVRISYAASEDKIKEACDRIKGACALLK